jgi:hypothetical protein
MSESLGTRFERRPPVESHSAGDVRGPVCIRSPIFVLDIYQVSNFLSVPSWQKCAQGSAAGSNPNQGSAAGSNPNQGSAAGTTPNPDVLNRWDPDYSPTVLEYVANRRFPDPDIWTHLQLFWERLPPEHRWIVGLGLGATVLGLLGGGNLLPGGLGGILGLGGLLAALGFSFLPENSPGRAMLTGRWVDIVRGHQMANFIQQQGGSPALVQYYRRHGRFPVPYFITLRSQDFQNILQNHSLLPPHDSGANSQLTPERVWQHWSTEFAPIRFGRNELKSIPDVLDHALFRIGLVPGYGASRHPLPQLSWRGWVPVGEISDQLMEGLAHSLAELKNLSPQNQEPLYRVLRYLPPDVVRNLLQRHAPYFPNALQNGTIHPAIAATLQQHQQLMDEATRLAEGIFRATPINTSNPPRTP